MDTHCEHLLPREIDERVYVCEGIEDGIYIYAIASHHQTPTTNDNSYCTAAC